MRIKYQHLLSHVVIVAIIADIVVVVGGGGDDDDDDDDNDDEDDDNDDDDDGNIVVICCLYVLFILRYCYHIARSKFTCYPRFVSKFFKYLSFLVSMKEIFVILFPKQYVAILVRRI